MWANATPGSRVSDGLSTSAACEGVAGADKHELPIRGIGSRPGGDSTRQMDERETTPSGARPGSGRELSGMPGCEVTSSGNHRGGEGPAKRPRLASEFSRNPPLPRQLPPCSLPSSPRDSETSPPCASATPRIVALPKDVLVSNLLARLDGASLSRVACTCRALSPLAEEAARVACAESFAAEERPQDWWR